MAPSHYLKQYWLIIYWTLRKKNPMKFKSEQIILIKENTLNMPSQNVCHFVEASVFSLDSVVLFIAESWIWGFWKPDLSALSDGLRLEDANWRSILFHPETSSFWSLPWLLLTISFTFVWHIILVWWFIIAATLFYLPCVQYLISYDYYIIHSFKSHVFHYLIHVIYKIFYCVSYTPLLSVNTLELPQS